ncbi:hypothetical protein FHY13_004098, partial [Xanthomonas arboricola]|uniref:hypothetical protein n=1 Tax=Xanthomonas euroxanthea TaxID=2259622 RepID=UPI0016184255
SILSIQIKAQAQQQGLEFALEALFERQTVARLAEVTTHGGTAVAIPRVEAFDMLSPQELAALDQESV